MSSARRPRQRAAWTVAMIAAVALLGWTFRGVDVVRLADLLRNVSPVAASFILLPQLLALAVESGGWRWAFLAIGRRVPHASLLRLRIATEAVALSLPCGVLWAESLKPVLLGRMCGVPVSDAISGMAARKYLLMSSQAAYIGLFAVLGWSALAVASPHVLGVPGLPWLSLGAACLVGLSALATMQLFRRSRIAAWLLRVLQGVPRLGPELVERARSFAEVDESVRRFFGAGARRSTLPATLFFVAWCIESLETYFILRVLGVELDFATVAAVEVTLSFLRNVVFLVPAGLGFQDAGYAAFLLALGTPEGLTVGAALALLKRSKDLFWISCGWLLLAWELKPVPRAVVRAGASA